MIRINLKIRVLFAVLLSSILFSCGSEQSNTATDLTPYLGVWANADCELVQTQKYTLFFERQDSKISVVLSQNEQIGDTIFNKFLAGFTFDTDGDSVKLKKLFPTIANAKIPFNKNIRLKGGQLVVRNLHREQTLKLVEKIDACPPYEMPHADMASIGKCLQSWQLGVFENSINPENVNIEIGTNKHVYVFVMKSDMLYCSAARIKHNNRGSVFAQNIRLMINAKTGEKTATMEENNLKISSSNVAINNSLFKPDECVYAKNGIYWSFISCTPTEIKVNGNEEEYTFARNEMSDETIVEWFAYKKY
jgi:hypothetical protein